MGGIRMEYHSSEAGRRRSSNRRIVRFPASSRANAGHFQFFGN